MSGLIPSGISGSASAGGLASGLGTAIALAAAASRWPGRAALVAGCEPFQPCQAVAPVPGCATGCWSVLEVPDLASGPSSKLAHGLSDAGPAYDIGLAIHICMICVGGKYICP